MNVLHTLRLALKHHADEVSFYPVTPNVAEMRRGRNGAPGAITVRVPDETVLSIRGSDQEKRDMLVFVRIPRAVVKELESGLVLPKAPQVIPGRLAPRGVLVSGGGR